MSTTPIRCPNPKCNAIVRVAVQPSRVVMARRSDPENQQLLVDFHPQVVARVCGERRRA